MRILGEADLDSDGVIHGWCWSPDRPDERVMVEILMDDEVVARLIASRFREDVRHRKFGDGYHGFTATLTRQITAGAKRSLISARERVSGTCFWHRMLGEFAIPPETDARLQAVRTALGRLAHQPALSGAARNKTARTAAALAVLGERLQTRAGRPAPPPTLRPFTLLRAQTTSLSVILDAGAQGIECLESLRRTASTLGQTAAEILLTDDGADPRTLRSQARAENLKYFYAPQQPPAARRNLAVAAARGGTLVFLSHARGRLGPALHVLHPHAQQAILLSPALADAARRIAPELDFSRFTPISVSVELGLTLAMPSAYFETYGPFDPRMDDGAGLDVLDWVLRAAKAGAPLAVWQGPHVPEPAMRPRNAEAGRLFAARWVLV